MNLRLSPYQIYMNGPDCGRSRSPGDRGLETAAAPGPDPPQYGLLPHPALPVLHVTSFGKKVRVMSLVEPPLHAAGSGAGEGSVINTYLAALVVSVIWSICKQESWRAFAVRALFAPLIALLFRLAFYFLTA